MGGCLVLILLAWNVVRLTSELGESYSHHNVDIRNRDELAKIFAKYGKDIVNDQVAVSEDQMTHDDERETPLTNMLADSYREATGADIALESTQLTNDGFGPGPLSTWQVMNTPGLVPSRCAPIRYTRCWNGPRWTCPGALRKSCSVWTSLVRGMPAPALPR